MKKIHIPAFSTSVVILTLLLIACSKTDAEGNAAGGTAREGSATVEGSPPVTAAEPMDAAPGRFAHQYELREFEEFAGWKLGFSENPSISDLYARIPHPDKSALGNVADRLPEEPLVIVPYNEMGFYGGTLNMISNATEAGTSDALSIRHVSLLRYSDDLTALIPNVARDWAYNSDYTELTFTLRRGHKWSDGSPFTAEDVAFWYNELILNPDVYPRTPSRYLVAGEPMEVSAEDETTVIFKMPATAPGMVNFFAAGYVQPFQPKAFFEERMETLGLSFKETADLYYRGSDWKDVPSPLLDGASEFIVPTLESHILVEETPERRIMAANPFFHAVDTQGRQLPYINEINELYVPDKELRNLKITAGEVDYKTQNVFIDDFPLYKENEERGNYTAYTAPISGGMIYYSFNVNHKDEAMREIFENLKFREAMSLAINREEINEVIYFGLGTPAQFTPADPNTVPYITEEQRTYLTDYDPEGAESRLNAIGLTDTNGDGFRENLVGDTLVVQIIYANQGGPVRIHELVQRYWEAVGIRVNIKEVSSDDYREQANNNNLDITTWSGGSTGMTLTNDTSVLVPPFGTYFSPGGGFEWVKYINSGGTEGIRPPEDITTLIDLTNRYVQYPLGSPEGNRLGREITEIHVKNLWKIGLVGSIQAPNMRSNRVRNFKPWPLISYDFYWAYPYRPVQWWLAE